MQKWMRTVISGLKVVEMTLLSVPATQFGPFEEDASTEASRGPWSTVVASPDGMGEYRQGIRGAHVSRNGKNEEGLIKDLQDHAEKFDSAL